MIPMVKVSARPVVLLVEDHTDTRQMYAEFLAASFDVLEAADGQQALAVLEQRVPAVVITDFSLPGFDGFELIRRIRRNHITEGVPVICLSGYGGRAHEQRAREVGCDRVLEKPCLPDVLAQMAQEMANRGRPDAA
jgi:two-component system phosphate regulon response regulator PhoB